uniref:C-type lectin domain-containing protein n=1 Tax=Gadus morhua TaxID=8049 RepID=A0A8C4ZW99_GADMO
MQTLLISVRCFSYRQHCLIETPKSWFDAQSYCRERGHDLATIDDMGAMKSLLALNADRADELWIGLHYGGPEEWHWSLADEEFYQKGERDYHSFVGLFPQSCAVMTAKGPGRWSTRRWVVKVKVRSEDIQELNDPATLKQVSRNSL